MVNLWGRIQRLGVVELFLIISVSPSDGVAILWSVLGSEVTNEGNANEGKASLLMSLIPVFHQVWNLMLTFQLISSCMQTL